MRRAIAIGWLAGVLAGPALAGPPDALFTLEPTFRAVEDHLGTTMALAGRDVLVGSLQEDYPGAAWTFGLARGAVALTLVRETAEPSYDYDFFGLHVAASRRLLVATSRYGVHIFDRAGRPLTSIALPPGGSAWSGVAAAGSRVLVGASPSTILFDLRTAVVRTFAAPEPNPNFGLVVAFAGDRVIVAAHGSAEPELPGAVHAFDASTGDLVWTARGLVPSESGGFGAALAVTRSEVYVGAPNDAVDGPGLGSVYVFDRRSGALRRRFGSPTGVPGESFGVSVAVHDHTLLVGAPDTDVDEPGAGVAHLLDARSGALLGTYAPLPNEEDAYAGTSVALTGSRIVIGGSRWDGYGTVTVYPR